MPKPQTGAYSCFHLKALAKINLIFNSIPYKINRVYGYYEDCGGGLSEDGSTEGLNFLTSWDCFLRWLQLVSCLEGCLRVA